MLNYDNLLSVFSNYSKHLKISTSIMQGFQAVHHKCSQNLGLLKLKQLKTRTKQPKNTISL